MRTIRRGSRAYPPLLEEIKDPPERLWCTGDARLLSRTSVAVVGSRAATRLGIEMAERIGARLAQSGVVVVSGCARGIDAAAHRAALRAGGATIGVLAGGLDVAAPPTNRRLAGQIARHGCLVSEHPAGVPPVPYLFPLRNRIIAGLARIVVVVEAAARSGALSTARHALAAGREVMAVPAHPLLSNSAGVIGLLRDGARPVLDAVDVLEELAGLPAAEGAELWRLEPPPPAGLPEARVPRKVLTALGDAPLTADQLAAAVGEPFPQVLAALTELEITGLVRMGPGQRYRLAAVEAAARA